MKNLKYRKKAGPNMYLRLKPFMIFLAGLSFLLTFSSDPALAQGDLLITPRRLVFDGSRRSADINLANTGKDTATYAISLIQIRMLDDGGFETIMSNFSEKTIGLHRFWCFVKFKNKTRF